MFSPSMAKSIQTAVEKCSICQTMQASIQREPLMSHAKPNYPWAKIGIDLFTIQEQNYCVVADYLSGYCEVDQINSKRVISIVCCMKQKFAGYSVLDMVFSHNFRF